MPSRSLLFTPLRIAHWALCSALLLTAGLAALVGTIFAVSMARGGPLPGTLQQQAWLVLALTVMRQVLLPLWPATLASWLLLVRFAPALDASWRRLAPGVLVLAALWFAPIGAFLFQAWTPTDARDVVGTLALCAGGVGAALLLPRLWWRALAPGAFAPRTVWG